MLSALYYFIKAWKYIFHPGYIKYIFFGALISILLFSGFSYGVDQLSIILGESISAIIPGSWTQESVVFSWLFRVLSFILLIGILKYLVLIVMSPLLSALSEKLEYSIIQNAEKKKSISFLGGGIRALHLNVSNLLREWFWSLGLFVLSFIPGLAIITTPAMILIQGYYTGFGIMDFYLERHAGVRESRKIVSWHRWFSMTLGTLFLAVFALPFLGFILAPILCVVAATLYLANQEK